MTGEQKIQFIRDQCNAIWESRQEVAVDCPYCLHSVKPGEGPCCVYMDKSFVCFWSRNSGLPKA